MVAHLYRHPVMPVSKGICQHSDCSLVNIAHFSLPSTAIAAGGTLIRAQVLIELLGGEVAELILHADHPSLGAKHDQIEANAFAKVAVAASPAVAALIAYCESEAAALIRANIEIVQALVEALAATEIAILLRL